MLYFNEIAEHNVMPTHVKHSMYKLSSATLVIYLRAVNRYFWSFTVTQVSGFRMTENRFITDITRIRAAW